MPVSMLNLILPQDPLTATFQVNGESNKKDPQNFGQNNIDSKCYVIDRNNDIIVTESVIPSFENSVERQKIGRWFISIQ